MRGRERREEKKGKREATEEEKERKGRDTERGTTERGGTKATRRSQCVRERMHIKILS